jgi:glycosyltransferase involved in cell wall biosynthesis
MLKAVPVANPKSAPVLSIVIPAYNEERGIEAILERVLAQREPLLAAGVADLEVIVVDDGSRDATAPLVAARSGVRLVRHPANRGYGAALKSGFSAAAGDLLAFLDADGTYPPEKLPQLCREALGGQTDIVIGSRMLGKDSEMPLVRRIGNTIFAGLLSIVGRRRIWDSASGMRVFKRSALAALYPLPDGLDFTPAMSTRALYEDLRMVEVPIPYRERVGRSKLNVAKDGLRFLRSILWTSTLYNPLGIFGTLGLLMLALAFVLGLSPTFYYLQHHSVLEESIYRLMAVLILSAAGVNVLAFGLISKAIFNLLPDRREGRPPLPRRVQGGLAWAGLASLLAGSALMAPSGLEWLRTAHISFHWSYFAAGGTLILAGLQLSTWFVLLTMVSDLTSRPARTRRDLRGQ